jgi:hypothetical protein
MTYEQLMAELNGLEARGQAEIDAQGFVSADTSAALAALEAQIEATPEWEALMERLNA